MTPGLLSESVLRTRQHSLRWHVRGLPLYACIPLTPAAGVSAHVPSQKLLCNGFNSQ